MSSKKYTENEATENHFKIMAKNDTIRPILRKINKDQDEHTKRKVTTIVKKCQIVSCNKRFLFIVVSDQSFPNRSRQKHVMINIYKVTSEYVELGKNQ